MGVSWTVACRSSSAWSPFSAVVGVGSAQAAAGRGGTSVVIRALGSGGWRAQPVRGARVRVFHGDRLVGRGAVGAQGMALVRARVRPGSALRVEVSGGRVEGEPSAAT